MKQPAQAVLGVEQSARAQRWTERLEPNRLHVATAIAQAHGLPDLLGRILAARGAELQSAERFLDPSLRTLMPDPASLQDMTRAAERMAEAITRGETIGIFGDYDVDGASCVALVERFLRAHARSGRQRCLTYIPDRLTEGYGPSPEALTGLAEEGLGVILTVDCGTAGTAAIAAANAAGADVIVLDHHQAGEDLPPAFAVVNPNRQDDLSGQGHLAAAGVVFLFLVATAAALRRLGAHQDHAEPDLLGLLDLVALATVCDVVPFKDANRAFIAKGLKVLRLRHNAGLRALADEARLTEAPSTYSLGFVLGPRINAGGRVAPAGLGARLLATEDEAEAATIAARLEALNAQRKAIETGMLEGAAAMADAALAADPDAPLLFLGDADWHKGLVGLVAGRLTERFQRPSFVMTLDADGMATGSARSIPSVDLGTVVRDAVEEGLFVKGGGHAMAAGFSLQWEKQAAARAFLSERLSGSVANAATNRNLGLDGALSAGGATPELIDLLDRAGPYGPGHPRPRFAFPAHRVTRLRSIGTGHLRCTLQAADGSRIDAVAFRVEGSPLGDLLAGAEGQRLHVAGHLRRSVWQGRERIELMIEDAAASQDSPT
ncbi:single-stranded-DNA-specific exonuclease RecJ [Methyloceanibacter methanicus]|uniref:Single-stranded-DNA-specific exonuclease RecJ n=1 Tax=Methyloceanibacter methanicus TaxID=1774968 RepID=A0A1E3W585_9HYPH|nr:single-stranded-DNA-specific exonuclease RecJ [Methyloceanibacter methanicus]ODS00979.1 single-stranded-DNA-specific exonuclease RecJ [Methyloceanibacter methanicus]